jgi:hypothetical protein
MRYDQGNRQLRVQALKLSDGTIPGGHPPLAISGSLVNDDGQTILLDQKQRAALLLTPLRLPEGSPHHKLLYVGFTGADEPPDDANPTHAHHGWIVTFDAVAWKQVGAWVATYYYIAIDDGCAENSEGSVDMMDVDRIVRVRPEGTTERSRPDVRRRVDVEGVGLVAHKERGRARRASCRPS